MQEFLSATQNIDEMLQMLKKYLIFDLKESYGQVRFRDEENLVQVMKDIYTATKHAFVILIDEWDCLFREYKEDKEAQRKYLDFLRAWLKDKAYVALAYMTGILPIKKYGSHSALNMFTEYSMTDPGNMAEYFGFTEEEVSTLCQKYSMNFEEAKAGIMVIISLHIARMEIRGIPYIIRNLLWNQCFVINLELTGIRRKHMKLLRFIFR